MRWLPLLVVLSCSLLAHAVEASPRERAYALYKKGEFRGAITLFLEAHRQENDAGLLYNVGKCYEKLAEYGQAIKYFKAYLLATQNAPDRRDVEALIADLNRRLEARQPEVEISSSPPGARLHVDESFAGETPLTLRVKPGNRRLRFELEGYEPKERLFQVRPEGDNRVAVLLSPLRVTGTLKVLGGARGARVLVDGELAGVLPMHEGKEVRAGLHEIEVEKEGLARFVQTVKVERGKERLVYVELESLERPTSKKAVAGFVLLGLAAASEGLAWLFYTRGAREYRGTPEYDRERGLTMGLHIGAGALAATSAALITWWLVERGRRPSRPAGAWLGPTFAGSLP